MAIAKTTEPTFPSESGLREALRTDAHREHRRHNHRMQETEHSDGLEQLKSYCHAEGTPIGVWVNGG